MCRARNKGAMFAILFSLLLFPSDLPAAGEAYGRIKRRVAAGVPTVRILRYALGDGLTDYQAVSEMVRAGARIDTVVYFAITEGLTAGAVVRAAIEQGMPAKELFELALNAGADPGDVVTSVADMGANPYEVANAIAKEWVAKSAL